MISNLFEIFYIFSDNYSIIPFIIISVLTGLVMLIIYKYVSNQTAITKVKDQLKSCFLEIRIYPDDLSIIIRALLRVLVYNFKYLFIALQPIVIIMIPVIFILSNLYVRYNFRSYDKGEEIVVRTYFKDIKIEPDKYEIINNSDFIAMSPWLTNQKDKYIAFKFIVNKNGLYKFKIKYNNAIIEKIIPVGIDYKTLYINTAEEYSFFYSIIHPVENFDKNNYIEKVEINLPVQEMNIFGLKLNFMYYFIIFSLLTGLLFKGIFKVEI